MTVPHSTMEDFLDDSDELIVEVVCLGCKRPMQFTVSKSGYDKWVSGELIQRALPEVPEDERELLINQTCGDCFDKMFADDFEDA